MKAVILDMYGVILKETGDGFVPYVRRTFPELAKLLQRQRTADTCLTELA